MRDELDDANARRQLDELLLEAKQPVIDPRRLGPRLFVREFADGEGMALAVIKKLAVPAGPFALKRCRGDVPPGNVTRLSAQLMQKNCRRSAFCTACDSP